MYIDYAAIGQRIKKIRKQRGYTQENLDVSIVYIRQIENGRTKLSLEILLQIADLLNEHPGFFLAGSTYQAQDYLRSDIAVFLESCSPEKRKLLMEVLKLIAKYPEK